MGVIEAYNGSKVSGRFSRKVFSVWSKISFFAIDERYVNKKVQEVYED